jgi:hypothetical protein
LATGAGAVDATVVAGSGGAPFTTGATGCGAVAWTAGAAAMSCAGVAVSATSSSFDLRPLKLKPERPGAEILRQDSWPQFFGASMRILCPSISKETELPAWAAVLAISNAAMM